MKLTWKYKDYIDNIVNEARKIGEFENIDLNPENINKIIAFFCGEIQYDKLNFSYVTTVELSEEGFIIKCPLNYEVFDIFVGLGYIFLYQEYLKKHNKVEIHPWYCVESGATRYFARAFMMPKKEYANHIMEINNQEGLKQKVFTKKFPVPEYELLNRGRDLNILE
jgi:hypothetical protein